MATPLPSPSVQPTAQWRILPLGREHVLGFHEALDRVAREGRYLAMLQAPPLSRTRRFVLDSLKDGAIHLVSVAAGEVVGWCDLRPRTNPAQRHSAVLGMGIVAEHRGRGLGRALLASTLERADARGLRRAELVVREDNVAAVSLYRQFGFVVEGRCRGYLRLDGIDHDALLMARVIDLTPG